MVTGIPLEQAVELLREGRSPLGIQRLPLGEALGRTLAEELTAPMDQPPFDRSPLDGYAIRAADTAGASREHPARLRVADTVYAGEPAARALGPGEAVRVTTGAMLPPGCDCVVRQEDTDRGCPVVSVFASLSPFQNYVNRGEDFAAGAALLPAGIRLDGAAVGLLASAGFSAVPVRRRPSVALLCTGDEVVPPGTRPLPAGKIYDANGLLLSARLGELGFGPATAERVGDDPARAAAAMARLLENHDVLFTTGGVSVGERDILHQALPLLGAERVFWRVALKPGSPALFYKYYGKPILSLSGNPFAAAATFELLGRPLLSALSGEPHLLPRRLRAVLDTPFPKSGPLRRFVRGRYQEGRVALPEGHSSGQLASLVGCSCLVDVPADSGPLAAGQAVDILLL